MDDHAIEVRDLRQENKEATHNLCECREQLDNMKIQQVSSVFYLKLSEDTTELLVSLHHTQKWSNSFASDQSQ